MINKDTNATQLLDFYKIKGYYLPKDQVKHIVRVRVAADAAKAAREQGLPSFNQFVKQRQEELKERLLIDKADFLCQRY